jgi:hypothetical protein
VAARCGQSLGLHLVVYRSSSAEVRLVAMGVSAGLVVGGARLRARSAISAAAAIATRGEAG